MGRGRGPPPGILLFSRILGACDPVPDNRLRAALARGLLILDWVASCLFQPQGVGSARQGVMSCQGRWRADPLWRHPWRAGTGDPRWQSHCAPLPPEAALPAGCYPETMQRSWVTCCCLGPPLSAELLNGQHRRGKGCCELPSPWLGVSTGRLLPVLPLQSVQSRRQASARRCGRFDSDSNLLPSLSCPDEDSFSSTIHIYLSLTSAMAFAL